MPADAKACSLSRSLRDLPRSSGAVPPPQLDCAPFVEQCEAWLAGRVYLAMRTLTVIDADDPDATDQDQEVETMAA